jgi:ABC-2 type transport system permease protein
VNTGHVLTVARTDLKQLIGARDFWLPMMILGGLFFVFVPFVLLLSSPASVTSRSSARSPRPSNCCPPRPRRTSGVTPTPGGPGSCWRSTSSAPWLWWCPSPSPPRSAPPRSSASASAGPASSSPTPPPTCEIYLGKLIASLLPGYATTIVGFGIYSLIVNTLVGPEVGGWFFPTSEWWVLMLWVVPPFLALTLSIVLRLSARVKSTAAAQQASGLVSIPLIMIAYSQSTGALFGAARATVAIGAIAWALAIVGLWRGMRSVSRQRLLGVADGI